MFEPAVVSLIVILALGLPLRPLFGDRQGRGSGVHPDDYADFQDFLHDGPQGVTLVFSWSMAPRSGEYHAPDLSVFLEYGNDKSG